MSSVIAPAHYISDIHQAASALGSISPDVVRSLLEVNRGTAGANMTTLGLAMAVTNTETYTLKGSTLKPLSSASASRVVDLETKASNPPRIETPLHLEIQAIWDDKTLISGSGNNILGGNGRLILEPSLIEIPSVEATDALLGYYGATLIEQDDIIHFPDEEFPLFVMEVGDRYVEDTLMTDAGGGFYLEYHHDKPHFHLPMRGSGNYLLAKWSEDHTKLQITGFRIPDGKAVYSKKGAIHCDAALTGDLLVGYSVAKDCSTVLLQNKDGKRVEVRFKEPTRASGFPIGAVKV